MRKLLLLMAVLPLALSAQHVVSIGAGWGDMGMTPTTCWKSYSWSQGSRKEVQSFASYKYVFGKSAYIMCLRYVCNTTMFGR